jgi:DNA-binding transcriptional ArsR family regulator
MAPTSDEELARYADMLAAMGAEPRLRVLRLLLTAHPNGLAAGDISAELEITPSTLSHHLDRLKREHVVTVRRQGTFLWYAANTEAIEQLLKFLFAECCARPNAASADLITLTRPSTSPIARGRQPSRGDTT